MISSILNFIIGVLIIALAVSASMLIITGSKSPDKQPQFKKTIRTFFFIIGVALMIYCGYLIHLGDQAMSQVKLERVKILKLIKTADSLKTQIDSLQAELDIAQDSLEAANNLNTTLTLELVRASYQKVTEKEKKYLLKRQKEKLEARYSEADISRKKFENRYDSILTKLNNTVPLMASTDTIAYVEYQSVLSKYQKLKKEYDEQKYIIKALDTERLGDESREKRKKAKYYSESLTWIRKANALKENIHRIRLEDKYKKWKKYVYNDGE